jgi:hypothetical protein
MEVLVTISLMKFRKFIKKTKAIHVRHIDVKKMASGNFLDYFAP